MDLTATEQQVAVRRIRAWQLDPAQVVACPRCDRPGLVIEDRSARPHAEWYVLSCRDGCGLSATLHLALGTPSQGLD